jgi:hypothetical protein
MINKNLIMSLVIFSFLMIFTSIIKNKTRLMEKNINLYNLKIAKLENNFHEAQLDFFYLSSPEYITKKILLYSNQEYMSIEYSKIYFSLRQFLDEKNKATKIFKNEK